MCNACAVHEHEPDSGRRMRECWPLNRGNHFPRRYMQLTRWGSSSVAGFDRSLGRQVWEPRFSAKLPTEDAEPLPCALLSTAALPTWFQGIGPHVNFGSRPHEQRCEPPKQTGLSVRQGTSIGVLSSDLVGLRHHKVCCTTMCCSDTNVPSGTRFIFGSRPNSVKHYFPNQSLRCFEAICMGRSGRSASLVHHWRPPCWRTLAKLVLPGLLSCCVLHLRGQSD